MAINFRDGVSILKLIIYLPYLFASIYVCYRHGFRRNSGWIFLVIFCILRIIGSCAQLATISSNSTTPYTIAAVTDAIGLSPLLLSSLGLTSRIFYALLETPYNFIFTTTVLRIPQTVTAVGAILCIVGATSANSPAEISTNSTLHIGIILYMVAFGILVLLSIGAAITRHCGHHGEGLLIAAVACSLPFILVRLVDSAVAAFGHDSSFNIVTGSVTITLVMVVLEEIAVVAIYTITGLKLEVVPSHQQSKDGGKNLMYRAGRGDFGVSKFGILSVLLALFGEITNPGKQESDRTEKAQGVDV